MLGIFVGIDQALTKTGICILCRGEVESLKFIKVPTKLTGPPRLAFLRDKVYEHLAPYAFHIAHAAIEAQSLGSIGDLDQLGQISGVMQIVLNDLGVEKPFKVPPALLKKFVANNAQASKEQMMDASKKLWGIAFENDDLCDAHGLARIAEEHSINASCLRYQIEVIKRLSMPKKKKPRLKKLKVNAI